MPRWNSMAKNRHAKRLFSKPTLDKLKKGVDERNKNLEERWQNMRDDI